MSFTSRILILSSAIVWASFCFTSCEKPSQKEPEVEVPITPPKSVFPFFRTMTDTKGRTIRAEVLGRDANTVTIVRSSDKRRFTLPLNTLSPQDQTHLLSLPITEPRAEDPAKLKSGISQRDSKRRHKNDYEPSGYAKLLYARIEEKKKEIRDIREEMAGLDTQTIRSRTLSKRILKIENEIIEIEKQIAENQ